MDPVTKSGLEFTTQAKKDLEIPDCWGLNIKFRL